MVLVDPNVPMYLVRADDLHKREAQSTLDHLVTNGERLVTNVEVFQEILHRSFAIGRKEAIQPAFSALKALVGNIPARQTTSDHPTRFRFGGVV